MSRGGAVVLPMGEPMPPPSTCVKVLYYTWRFFSVVFSHFVMICLVIAYSILGAFVFQKLEAEHEMQIKRSIAWIRGNVTHDIWRMTNNSLVLRQDSWTEDVTTKLKDFEDSILHAMKRDGWDGIENPDSIQWTFTGALFYSIIVITTIGYGHIAPKTQTGKVTTILYAIVGIPLMLLCLSSIGDVMASSFRFLYWRVCCYVCTRPPKRRRRHRTLSRNPSMHRSVKGRGTSMRRKTRSQTMPVGENHSHSDTECRYRDSGYGTAPGSTNPKRSHAPRVRSQPPTNRRPQDHLRPSQSCQDENSYGRRERDRFYKDVVDDVFPPISLPLHDLDSALKDLERHRRARPGDQRSKSLPRPPQQRKRTEQEYYERDNVHSLCDIDYENYRERKAGLYRPHDVDDYSPDDDFDRRRSDRNYQEYREPGRRRARSMMYETGGYYEQRHSRPYLRRLDTRDEMAYRDHRYSVSPERHGRNEDLRACRLELPDNWVDIDNAKLGRHKNIPGFSNRTSELQLQILEPAIKPQIKPVPIWLCVLLVVSYVIAGTFLFNKWESWSFLDSAYFCFITLTTIGFGDFVPAQGIESDAAAESIALCSLYLLFGISLLAMSFNLVQEEVISNVKAVAKKLGIIKSDGEESESEL